MNRSTAKELAALLFALGAFVCLTTTRVLAAAGQDDAVARLPAELRTWLEDEVWCIITDRERQVFLSLETVEERRAFIDVFWRRRDPVAATPHNELRDEHYRRLAYADEHFQEIRSRPGRHTDRGRMYVILGDPRNVEQFDNYNQIFTAELWFYGGDPHKGLPPFFYLLFFKPQDVGEFRLYSPVLDTPSALVRGNLGAETSRAVETLYGVSQELARASLTFDATAPVNRMDTSVARLGTEQMLANIEDSPKRAVKTDYLDGFLQYGKRVSAEYSFNFVPSRSAHAVLLGPSGSRMFHYAVEIDFENFPMETDEARTRYYTTVDVTLEVRDGEGALVLADDKESFVELTRSQVETGSGESFSYQDGIPLIPGDYDISVVLRNRVLRQYTVAEWDVEVKAVSAEEPALSDLVLGFQIEEDAAARGTGAHEHGTFEVSGLRVQPAADGLFAVGDPAFVFCQVASVGTGHRLRISLESDGASIQEHEVTGEALVSQPVIRRLDLTALMGGNYVVRAELLSPAGTTLASREAPLVLSPRTRVPRPGFTARRSFDAAEPGLLAMTLGDQLWARGRFDEAQAKLEQAVLERNPNLPMARWKLAGAYIRGRDGGRALALLEPLASDFPDQYEVVLGLGLGYYLEGQLEDALGHLEHATTIRPPSTSLLNALGDIYNRLDRPGDARRAFERSLELDPDQESIRELIAALPSP